MQDEPRPTEILASVARYLREVIAPATSGHISFNARVCANAIEMSLRQMEREPTDTAAEVSRLEALLGEKGDLATLNAELARRLETGEIDLAAPGLKEHLWAVTLAKLAVDQPTYAAYRAEVAERNPSPGGRGRGPRPKGVGR